VDRCRGDSSAAGRGPIEGRDGVAHGCARALRQFRGISAVVRTATPIDFNFDVESTERIVCSELVYLVYPDVPWPSSPLLGRAIVSPDHVAQMALAGGPLDLVRFYYDGERLGDDAEQVLASLVKRAPSKRSRGER
jgi:hypothetical protein